MKNKMTGWPEAVLTFFAVCMLGVGFLLPGAISERLVYMGACAVLPEGCLYTVPKTDTKEATTSEAQSVQKTVEERDLTATPKDILAWIAQAQKIAATQKKDGDIREQTYGKANATHTFQDICIRNITGDVFPDYEAQWKAPVDLKIEKDKPAVLIYHTHTTEGYETLDRDFYAADVTSRTTDTSRNVARVGTAIAQELERAGFEVIHDTTVHDTRYSGAYDRSRATIEKVLKAHPNISVVLDVHRDAIEENNGVKVKPVTTIDGKKSAQVMIIAGAEGGNVEDFPNWEKNLRFAMHLQSACETEFPGLMRPIFFCHRKYNMDRTPCSLLVEFGSEANTLQQAEYAGRMFGHALGTLLQEYMVQEE